MKEKTIVKINPESGLEGSVMSALFLDECRLVKELSIGINTKDGIRKFERGARIVTVGKRDITREQMDDPNFPYQPDTTMKEYLHISGRTYNTRKGPVFVADEIKKIGEEEYRALI